MKHRIILSVIISPRFLVLLFFVFFVRDVYGQIHEVKRNKICAVCKIAKPVNEFSGNSQTCKSCGSKAEAEKKRKMEAKRKDREQAEAERRAQEQLEKERIANENAEVIHKANGMKDLDDLFNNNKLSQTSLNYSELFEWYKKAAELGNARAQNNLGILYYEGLGTTKSVSDALIWFQKASEQGYAKAQNNLGRMYRFGLGVTKDVSEAVKWYRKAAEQGNAVAQYNLGYSYISGNGIEKNQEEALKWYRKAADQGIAKAQTILGLYHHQKGETAQAKEWYEKAAAQGDEDAKKQLSQLEYLSSVNSQTAAPQNSSATSSASGNRIETIIVNGVSFNMVRVEGGTFLMGATKEQDKAASKDEKPVHQVTLSSFYIGETEVTQELWETVMGGNPSYYKGAKRPVEQVSWNDCQTFIQKLKHLTGRNFRLPTEAEWEYAARGGNKSQGYIYAGSNSSDDVAWDRKTTNDKGTHEVKTKQSNELDIYDMTGNVHEWCQDWYGTYSKKTQTDPVGLSSGTARVFRGGSCHNFSGFCRVSKRFSKSPDHNDAIISLIGLRLVLQ